MKQIQVTKFLADNGRVFDYEWEAKREDEWNAKIASYVGPDQEIEQLIKDIVDAKNQASDPKIIDTFSFDGRKLFYVKNVVEKFYLKHKDLKMV